MVLLPDLSQRFNGAAFLHRSEMLDKGNGGGSKAGKGIGGQARIVQMRLICPNCSAQYEVDGSMIPDDGRDVQCSNCGHTWFELPEPSSDAATAEPASALPEDEFEEEDIFDAPPPYDLDDDDNFEVDEPGEDNRPKTTPEFLSRAEFEDDDDVPGKDDDAIWDDDVPDEEPEATEEEDRASLAVKAVTSAAQDSQDLELDPEDNNGGFDEEATSSPEAPEDDVADEEDTDDSLAAAAGRQRRPADAAALDILREEAEREMSQRRAAQSDAFEMQTDLGLEDIRNRRTPSRALRARMAHLGEEAPEEFEAEPVEDVPAPKPAPDPNKTRLARQSDSAAEDNDGYEEPKRDLLPDIDEINSTLRKPAGSPGDLESSRRSGFRAGFLIMLFLTAAAIFAYAQAPAIARALPDTEAAMISYVDWANGVRDWVDGLIAN